VDEVDVNRLQDLHKEVAAIPVTSTGATTTVREVRREVGT
jgi:hypothetical protein